MKTKFTIIVSIACLLITLTTHAQNWLTTGNSGTNPSINFLGTLNNKALVFRTHNIARMRITNSGRIGIGTTSPQQTLDVHGSINFDSALYLNNSKVLYYDGELHLDAPGEGTTIIGKDNQDATGLSVNGFDALLANGGAFGVIGQSDAPYPGIFSAGVYAKAVGGVGVICESDSGYGISALTRNPDTYAGYFTGNIYTTGSYIGSDEKLKQDVQDFSSAMNIINQLHPKQYQYRHDGNYKLMNLPQGQHYGLVAQDVEKILPDLVKDSKFNVNEATPHKFSFDPKNPNQKLNFQISNTNEVINFKALNYTELIPILIKGIQEQEQSIEALKQINQQQQEQINQLKSLVESRLGGSSVKTTILNSAALLQNVPNPYKNISAIQYVLPAKFSAAQIIITDYSGKVLKQTNISGAGKGSLNINTSSWAAGNYNYSLWIDGKLIDTRQMVLTK